MSRTVVFDICDQGLTIAKILNQRAKYITTLQQVPAINCIIANSKFSYECIHNECCSRDYKVP